MAKKDDKPKRRRGGPGRKSKYFTHVEPKLTAIEGWARDGLIVSQIAHNCGVADSTFRSYVRNFPELAEVMKASREVADYEVEGALFKRALGYEYEEKTYEMDYEGDKPVKRLAKVVTKRVPPDTTAAIFWLINRTRQTGKWMDTRRIEHSGPEGGPVELKTWADMVMLAEDSDGDADEEAAS